LVELRLGGPDARRSGLRVGPSGALRTNYADDLATDVAPSPPANDDEPTTKPAGKPRKKATRNIGALPKHLPRCEQVFKPDVP